LRSLLWDAKLPGIGTANLSPMQDQLESFEIYRLKARLPLDDGAVKIVQGVREVFEISDAPEHGKVAGNGSALTDQGKLVFIGRNITGLALEASYFSVINSP
jgi:Cobalamin synthesis protein cobW C-terminal domain